MEQLCSNTVEIIANLFKIVEHILNSFRKHCFRDPRHSMSHTHN